MTTKDQERAALAKIRKIVEDLGEQSYIGTALDGALELADTNIENDFGDSARYFIDRVYALEREHNAVRQQQTDTIKTLERDLTHANSKLDTLQSCYDELYGKYHEANAARIGAEVALDAIRADANAKDAEIVRLKAKLYDLMTQGA